MATKPRLELVWEKTCPNVEPARELLRSFLTKQELPWEWKEWEVSDSQTPLSYRELGSPTILVNGEDVSPQENQGQCCRLYRSEEGKLQGIPSLEQLERVWEQKESEN